MELSDSKIKKILIFSQKMFFLYFRKWNPALLSPSSKNKKKYTAKKILIFREMELSCSNI